MPDALNYGRYFQPQTVIATPDTLFTLSDGVLRNLSISIANRTASAASINAWVVPSGGVASNDNQFLQSYSISGNDTETVAVPKMVSGDDLVVQSITADTLAVFENDGVGRV